MTSYPFFIHSTYFLPLLISSKITIIIQSLLFFSLLAKEASVDISIRLCVVNDQPLLNPNFSRQAAKRLRSGRNRRVASWTRSSHNTFAT